MSEYKDTLNLPKTDFPMRGNLAQREPQMLKEWESQNLYQKIRDICAGRKNPSCMTVLPMPTGVFISAMR